MAYRIDTTRLLAEQIKRFMEQKPIAKAIKDPYDLFKLGFMYKDIDTPTLAQACFALSIAKGE